MVSGLLILDFLGGTNKSQSDVLSRDAQSSEILRPIRLGGCGCWLLVISSLSGITVSIFPAGSNWCDKVR